MTCMKWSSNKLKYKEIKEWREALLKEQGGLCLLCETRIRKAEAALDHCHETGRIRGVLHKDCNVLLGKIENYIKGRGKRMDKPDVLSNFFYNVFRYRRTSYTHRPLHPTFITPTDRLMRKYKRLLRKSKRPATKEKYKRLIQELK